MLRGLKIIHFRSLFHHIPLCCLIKAVKIQMLIVYSFLQFWLGSNIHPSQWKLCLQKSSENWCASANLDVFGFFSLQGTTPWYNCQLSVGLLSQWKKKKNQDDFSLGRMGGCYEWKGFNNTKNKNRTKFGSWCVSISFLFPLTQTQHPNSTNFHFNNKTAITSLLSTAMLYNCHHQHHF